MKDIKDSNDSGCGHKTSRKRKPQTGDPSIPDGTPSKKTQKTSAGASTPATVDNGQPRVRLILPLQRLAQQASNSSVADMAQATPAANTEQTTAAPTAGVQGGPASDYNISLGCAYIAYKETEHEAAEAYLRAYIDRGIVTVPVSASPTASNRTTWDLARQEYDRFAASLVDRMGIKNDTIVGWAHSTAKEVLQLLLPTQPDKVLRAMAQLKRYAPV
ncbi:hypothetical protein LTR17_016910 [Elasticomyces elasticus]|nr:hypothetical protein LTR17_016910 [Elasticomyces elasticus]